MPRNFTHRFILVLTSLFAVSVAVVAKQKDETFAAYKHQFKSLGSAIADLISTYGDKYPNGHNYLQRLKSLEKACSLKNNFLPRDLNILKHEALLDNPVLDSLKILVVKRKAKNVRNPIDIGFPSNHECNSSLPRTNYNNEIAILSNIRRGGKLTTLYKPGNGGYVGEIDLNWDGDRLLFTLSDLENWRICEINIDGSGFRKVSRAPADVDCFDACYLPNGKIIFCCTASYQSVPCWHGQKKVSTLYIMDNDGKNVRQLCFDQDHDFHPSVLNNGQVIYHRWDYTGINHIFMRQLMSMNPDGTDQKALYGSNSWYPNSLYFPRVLPEKNEKIVCILSGYHGVHRMGQLVIIDMNRGSHEAGGIVKRISGRNQPVTPKVKDNLVDGDWPKFLHPYPLSNKYFLVSCWMKRNSTWDLYLADIFDNLVLLKSLPDNWCLFEPVPIKKRPVPPCIPCRIDPGSKTGLVYLYNVYSGAGLKGVPAGTVKKLRVLAYDFGYLGLAGPDKVGYGGPWEVMRILGTVPVNDDGSVFFKVPADTPLAVQPLDSEGKAIQLMRSWFTVMPGESLSCIGCHESPGESVPVTTGKAAQGKPREIIPWYGPARGFDFEREVQPVLDKFCVSCHNDNNQDIIDLRGEQKIKDYKGLPISTLGRQRLDPVMKRDTGGFIKYTPAYDALLPYVRRVGIEDDVSLLVPGEYHADTSELIQMLKKRHHGVRLDQEAWDRIVTWIDLNCPCHGTWSEVHPFPNNAHERRMYFRKLYGCSQADCEIIPKIPHRKIKPVKPLPLKTAKTIKLKGWPETYEEAKQAQEDLRVKEKIISLADGVTLKMTHIPPGEFIMGDRNGEPDEYPQRKVNIKNSFWMASYEVTNEQFRLFNPDHDSRYYAKRHARSDDRGMTLNLPKQPVVRVSWKEAMDFCRWLSLKTGLSFTLPTEAQWEYACRAGTATPFSFGGITSDFSLYANLADKSFSHGWQKNGLQITGGLEHLALEGAKLADKRFSDNSIVTSPVGMYKSNAWGIFDLHGNAAEWTITASYYKDYPYKDNDGRNVPGEIGRKVVRGGSFSDRPNRCRSSFRLAYPFWQKVFNVGFRVVCNDQGNKVACEDKPSSRPPAFSTSDFSL